MDINVFPVEGNNPGLVINTSFDLFNSSNLSGTSQMLSTSLNLNLEGDEGDNTLTGGAGNDILTGLDGIDRLIAKDGEDLLIGGKGGDILVGGNGKDGFVYESPMDSLVAQPDRLTDLNLTEGDKIELSDLPANFYYSGNLVGGSLVDVLEQAYGDKDTTITGAQALQVNEGVMFTWRSRMYISVNYNTSAFEPYQDLVIDITGMKGALPPEGIAYEEDFFTTQNPSLLERVSKRWQQMINPEDYPLIGIIDDAFSGDQQDLNYSNLILGSDRLQQDNSPLSIEYPTAEHGTKVLGIIGATRNNNYGIDGINDKATIWLGRAIGSGEWAESVVEFVDTAKEAGKTNAVLNLSFELTEINPNEDILVRRQLTTAEYAALEYAQRNQVIIVAAAGNEGNPIMSALGEAAKEFDNIITVGAADGLQRASYSNYGDALDILAQGGTPENPIFSLTSNYLAAQGITEANGTSLAAAKVAGAISYVWGINSELNYTQVIDVITKSAKDIGTPGWDAQTGFGLLDMSTAFGLAQNTQPKPYEFIGAKMFADLLQQSGVPEVVRRELLGFYNYYDQQSFLDNPVWDGSDGVISSERGVIKLPPLIEEVGDWLGDKGTQVYNWTEEQINGGRNTLNTWIRNGENELRNFGNDVKGLIDNAKTALNNLPNYGGFVDGLIDNLNSLYDRYFKGPIEKGLNELRNLNLRNEFANLLATGERGLNSLYDKFFAGNINQGWLDLGDLRSIYDSFLNPGIIALGNPLGVFQGIINSQGSQPFGVIEGEANTFLDAFELSIASGDIFASNNNRAIIDAWREISLLQNNSNNINLLLDKSLNSQKSSFDIQLGMVGRQIGSKFGADARVIGGINNILQLNYTKAFDDAYNQFNDLFVFQFNQILAEANAKISSAINGVNGLIGTAQRYAADSWNNARDNINYWSDRADEIVNTLSNNLNSNLNKANGVLDKVWKNLPLNIGQLLNDINSRFDTFRRNYVSNPWNTNGLNPFNQLSGGDINAYNVAFNRLNTVLTSVNNSSYINNAINIAQQGINGLDSFVRDARQAVGVDNQIARIKDNLLNGKYIGEAWDLASEELGNLRDFFFDESERAYGELGKLYDKLGDAWSKGRGEYENLKDSIENKTEAWGNKLEQSINKGFDKFQETSANNLRNVWEKAQEGGQFVGNEVDAALNNTTKALQDIEAILKDPSKLDDVLYREYLKQRDALKAGLEWLNNKVINPLFDEAIGFLKDNANPLTLGLDLAEKAGVKIFDGLKDKWQNDWSPIVHQILGSVDNNTAKTANTLVYVLEGDYSNAWNGVKDLFDGTFGKIIDAGKLAVKGDWENAVRKVLDGLNVEIPENQVERFLQSNDPLRGAAVQAIAATGISVKTAEAALSNFNNDNDGYTNDDQIHGILNIIGFYNIPIASWIAKAADLGYNLVEAGRDFTKNPEDGIKQIITGGLSVVKVQNASDWVDAAFFLGNAVNEKVEDKKIENLVNAVGSVLEAIDVDHGKEWVNGAYDLFKGVKDNDVNSYLAATTNLIIAAADIEDNNKKEQLKGLITTDWFAKAEDQFRAQGKNTLGNILGNQQRADILVDMAWFIKDKNEKGALTKGFELAGFGEKSQNLVEGLYKLKDSKYIDGISELVKAVGSKESAQLVDLGVVLSKITFNLEFDQSKQNALIAILKTLDTGNEDKQLQQAGAAISKTKKS